MSQPNCTIRLTFFQIPEPTFAYHCTSCSQGWHVHSDGSIHPPSRSRHIEIDLVGFPAHASFAGFQLVSDPQNFPAETQPWFVEPGLDVSFPLSLPLPGGSTTLAFDLTSPGQTLFYRLAVLPENSAIVRWDDPKIYNEPDQ